MIRHRPLGSGHAYRIDLDQRCPVVPVAGEPLVLGATTAPADGDEVDLELVRAGRVTRLRAEAADREQLAAGGGSGHLAQAAAGAGRTQRRAWRVRLTDLREGEHLRYRFVAGRHRTRWHDVEVGSWASEGGVLELDGPETLRARLVASSVRWLVSSDGTHRVAFALRLEPDERVVGFGERFDRVDQRGAIVDAVVFEQYKAQGNRTYLPMPFAHVVSSRGAGFGLHVDTGRRVRFDVGATQADLLQVELSLNPADPHLRVRLFEGSPARVLAQFVRETGPATLPPDWVFEPWMSSNEWNTQERVLAEVARTRSEGIPAGVVVIEAWSDEATFVAFRDAEYEVHSDGAPHRLGDFTFPAGGAWPDPKSMVDALHDQGLRLLLWQIPLLKVGAAPGSQLEADRRALVERGLAVRQADGRPYANRGWWFPRALLPDFTHPEARRWWTGKRRYLVDELGVDGFKTDGGEHAWGDDLRYADGTRGAETNNRYPQLYADAYQELLDGGVTFSRSGFTGAAGTPCHWAGDEDSTWEAFRASVVAGITAGACGVSFWGWDIGGFSGEIPGAELYLRAAAMACFCPIMQYHSEFNHHRTPCRDRTPWNVAERTGDERVVGGYRLLARLRMRLVPYLVRQARITVETGRPLMRALFFDHGADARIWDFPTEYLLGDDLLVCPVVQPGVQRATCYVPAGRWVDLWDGSRVDGGEVVQVDAPVDRIPVFLRREAAALRLELLEDE
jgi:alpha-glucosidase (family GH31 glycosyl hydrolase)